MTTQELLNAVISEFIEARRANEPTLEELRECACITADKAFDHIMTTEDLDELCAAWVTYCGQYNPSGLSYLYYCYRLMAQRCYEDSTAESFTAYIYDLVQTALEAQYYTIGE